MVRTSTKPRSAGSLRTSRLKGRQRTTRRSPNPTKKRSDSKTTEGDHDELFEEALRICVEMKRASTSVLQRRLRIGYGRAAAILDIMEREGLIGAADGSRPRPVLGRAYEMVADWDEMGVAEE